MKFNRLFINGAWIPSSSKKMIEVENPSTLEIIDSVPDGNRDDVNLAIESASKAYAPWRSLSLEERKTFLSKSLEILQGYFDEILDLEVKELGAPVNWAKAVHVKGPLKRFEHFLKIIDNFQFQIDLPKARILKEPYGVVACLTPWNYPLGQVMQKIIPAMLAGNTVVLKPSQNTPLTAFYLCRAFEEAKLPSGVFNMVTGRGSAIGKFFAESPDVKMISFTGSTSAGKSVLSQSVDTLKRVALELGGKSPLVVLPGGKIEDGIRDAMESTFYNTGQTCAAFTRLLVPNKNLEEAEALAKSIIKEYNVGDPTLEETQVGPLASKSQFEKVKGFIQKGIEEGAKLIAGEIPENFKNGYFVKPAVFSRVSPEMTIAQEEIFGPVLVIMPYEDLEDAKKITNSTIYGLSSGVIGPREDAEKFASFIEAGEVYINDGRWDSNAPFGGYKQSGIGREGGLFGIEEFTQMKTIYDK